MRTKPNPLKKYQQSLKHNKLSARFSNVQVEKNTGNQHAVEANGISNCHHSCNADLQDKVLKDIFQVIPFHR
jgi:hypothetical protein